MIDYILNKDRNLKDALHKLDKSQKKCLIIVNKSYNLIGTLTD